MTETRNPCHVVQAAAAYVSSPGELLHHRLVSRVACRGTGFRCHILLSGHPPSLLSQFAAVGVLSMRQCASGHASTVVLPVHHSLHAEHTAAFLMEHTGSRSLAYAGQSFHVMLAIWHPGSHSMNGQPTAITHSQCPCVHAGGASQ